MQKQSVNVTGKERCKQNVNISASVKDLNCVLEEFGDLFDEKSGSYSGSAVEMNVIYSHHSVKLTQYHLLCKQRLNRL